jgi:hypothetical protein
VSTVAACSWPLEGTSMKVATMWDVEVKRVSNIMLFGPVKSKSGTMNRPPGN